eukprot:TRINITY_DN15663_c0_g2_i1.p1 TRINITY_DN15663_c0_g2~~TRINITY_DN15663_c0_g2_i1.p1  ORF type:complete len:409 (-),score=46.20 TRINITY_DN15663_c0_g2_i1:93-1235(-)
MTIARLLYSVILIMSKVFKNQGSPTYIMTSLAFVGGTISFVVVAFARRPPIPEPSAIRWVLLRGGFCTATFVCQMLAVNLGAPLGDVATLTSINMIVAALFGRVMLDEKLNWFHALGLISSGAGVTLIARPPFLFGGGDLSAGLWVGYVLAVASGICQASIFICSRKSQKVSEWIDGISALGQAAVGLLFIPYAVGLERAPWVEIAGLTYTEIFWTVVLALACATCTSMQSWAAKRCPAAISAMVSTSTSMLFGYLGQIVFFDTQPVLSTLIGAVLMMIGVIMVIVASRARVASAKKAAAKTAMEAEEAARREDGVAPVNQESGETRDDETESLAEFIHTEFLSMDGAEALAPCALRQRRDKPPTSTLCPAVPAIVGVSA